MPIDREFSLNGIYTEDNGDRVSIEIGETIFENHTVHEINNRLGYILVWKPYSQRRHYARVDFTEYNNELYYCRAEVTGTRNIERARNGNRRQLLPDTSNPLEGGCSNGWRKITKVESEDTQEQETPPTQEENNQQTEETNQDSTASLSITGTYTDQWSGTWEFTPEYINMDYPDEPIYRFNIIEINETEKYIIAQNDASNRNYPNLFLGLTTICRPAMRDFGFAKSNLMLERKRKQGLIRLPTLVMHLTLEAMAVDGWILRLKKIQVKKLQPLERQVRSQPMTDKNKAHLNQQTEGCGGGAALGNLP